MRGKSLLWTCLVILLFSSMTVADIPIVGGSLEPKIYVDPKENNFDPGIEFTVDVKVENAPEYINAWGFTLRFDPVILSTNKDKITEGDFLKVWLPDTGDYAVTQLSSDVTPGTVTVGCTLLEEVRMSGGTPPSGNGTLVSITLLVLESGETALKLSDARLTDYDDSTNVIEPPVESGRFYTRHPKADFIYYTETHPPTSPGVQPSFKPVVNEIITFNATFISFDGRYGGSYDPDGEIVSYAWNFGDGTTKIYVKGVNLTATTTHAYSTPDDYLVTLTVTDNATLPLTDTRERSVKVEYHDIAIDVKVFPTIIRPGELAFINVTVVNEGSAGVDEWFNVTAYYVNVTAQYIIWYNKTENKREYSLAVEKDPVTKKPPAPPLKPDENLTITFTWNTTGVAEGTYTIRANASLVDQAAQFLPGETDLADNEKAVPDIPVTWGAPVADFTFSPEHPMPGETVTFTSTSTDLDGYIVSWDWDWGDGTAHGTLEIDTHVYTEEGTYPVTLTVTDNASMTVTSPPQSITVSVHDLAILDVPVSLEPVIVGENASVYVIVKNQGGFKETFNVTAYYDGNVIETHTDITLNAGIKETYEFTWNTTGLSIGAYTIKAEVSVVPNEINITNNFQTAAEKLNIIGHNIAIQSIDVSPTTVKVGDSITVSVTVKNEGNFSETFDVTAYYDTTVIGQPQNVTSLAPGNTTTQTFTWNTTGVAVGNYTIKAESSMVPGETETADNTKIYGIITIEKMSSTISLTASPATITVGETITISGTIDPTRAGATVTIWFRLSGALSWNELTSVTTNETSQYSFPWEPQESGTYEVKASWNGDDYTLSDESDPQTVTVEEAPIPSILLYAAAGIAIIFVATVLAVYFIKARKE